MTFRRILVAVDDSPGGVAAARFAVGLAAETGAAVRAITVLADHALAAAIGGEPDATQQRQVASGRSIVGWVADHAAAHDVACETVLGDGAPFRRILREADGWDADLIVMGRSDRRGPASPYLGSETAHVLEFSDRPVLVVPLPRSERVQKSP